MLVCLLNCHKQTGHMISTWHTWSMIPRNLWVTVENCWMTILHFKIVLAWIFIEKNINKRKTRPYSQFYSLVTSKYVPLTKLSRLIFLVEPIADTLLLTVWRACERLKRLMYDRKYSQTVVMGPNWCKWSQIVANGCMRLSTVANGRKRSKLFANGRKQL